MATIEVQEQPGGDGWRFTVTVREGGSSTTHQVSLSPALYQQLSDRAGTPADLVRESFAFLLEREPKESILRSFDLSVIGRYFPEYETQLRRR